MSLSWPLAGAYADTRPRSFSGAAACFRPSPDRESEPRLCVQSCRVWGRAFCELCFGDWVMTGSMFLVVAWGGLRLSWVLPRLRLPVSGPHSASS